LSGRDTKAADQVLARHSARVSRVFDLYCQRLIARRFTAFRILGEVPSGIPRERGMIVFSNHSSWYDPLIFFVTSRAKFPSHTAFGPMDADALKKYAFMQKIGIFGVEQDSVRGAARFLQVSRGLLARPGNGVWMTPQGEFADVRARPVRFQGGLARLARDSGAIAIPMAIELVFWNEARPELLVHFGDPVDTATVSRDVDEWNRHLEQALTTAQNELAEAAMSRDPARFTTFIDGTTGVNYIYDGWRYVKALLRGERFSAAHGSAGRGRNRD
jgi:1-acyl-sn-glycerol-3-phosphate acyltransferase